MTRHTFAAALLTASFLATPVEMALAGEDDPISLSNRRDIFAVPAAGAEVYGRGGNDAINGGPGDDTLIGGPGDDTLRSGAGRNVLRGGDGNDRLVGQGDEPGYNLLVGAKGNDALLLYGWGTAYGSEGDDTINGFRMGAYTAVATLVGGPGADLFWIRSTDDGPGANPYVAIVRDFTVGDRLNLTSTYSADGRTLSGAGIFTMLDRNFDGVLDVLDVGIGGFPAGFDLRVSSAGDLSISWGYGSVAVQLLGCARLVRSQVGG